MASKKIWTEISSCRLCGSTDLQDVVNLGDQPPANSLRNSLTEVVPAAPLRLVHCAACAAAQLTATVEPEYLFSKYVWVTATSSTAREYSQYFCDEVLKRVHSSAPFVVEVASNDGTFLRRFKDRGGKILGVDPAQNIASEASSKGIPTLPEFFDEQIAKSIINNHGQPDLVMARNVIPHVKEIHSIIKGLATLAGTGGVAVIEFHYAKKIVDELHYDSIYHEHLFYFSLKSLTNLCARYGLNAFDVFASPISGGSLVLFLSASAVEQTPQLRKMIADEESSGLNTFKTWQKFGNDSNTHAQELANLVKDYKKRGALVGYGASARSSTMLNFAGICNNQIDFIIDRSSLKHGKYTPGTDIPIVSFEDGLMQTAGKNLLLLAWNFEQEVVADLRSNGFKGDIIVPLPNKICIR